jgi:hypothetical protein
MKVFNSIENARAELRVQSERTGKSTFRLWQELVHEPQAVGPVPGGFTVAGVCPRFGRWVEVDEEGRPVERYGFSSSESGVWFDTQGLEEEEVIGEVLHIARAYGFRGTEVEKAFQFLNHDIEPGWYVGFRVDQGYTQFGMFLSEGYEHPEDEPEAEVQEPVEAPARRQWHAYIVYAGSKVSTPTTSKKKAIALAKQHEGAEVRSMPWWFFNECSSWDGPTFYVQSERVYPSEPTEGVAA